MKYFFPVFFVLLSTTILRGQDSYTIKMQVRTEGLPPEYAAYGEQEIITYIKGEKSKTEISSVMYNSTIYFDGKQLTTLNDIMGNKQGYSVSKEELKDLEDTVTAEKPVVKYTGEKKMIAGYECTKALITSKGQDNKPVTVTAWVTDKIQVDRTPARASKGMNNLGDLKGQPLEMEMSHSAQGTDVKMIMTTKEVLREPIDDSVFEADTSGYKMVTYQEWQEQVKAMGGK